VASRRRRDGDPKIFRTGAFPSLNSANGGPVAPPWHALPSPLNGFAVQFDEIGDAPTSVRPAAERATPPGVSRTNRGAAGFTKCPANSRSERPTR
jgi:hypothetical protein